MKTAIWKYVCTVWMHKTWISEAPRTHFRECTISKLFRGVPPDPLHIIIKGHTFCTGWHEIGKRWFSVHVYLLISSSFFFNSCFNLVRESACTYLNCTSYSGMTTIWSTLMQVSYFLFSSFTKFEWASKLYNAKRCMIHKLFKNVIFFVEVLQHIACNQLQI